ncbi:MAG: YesL family protein [Lachnospiraceae bacterium]|nr:YesL family protein [Lachnospiraceae bacterium]
MSVEGFNYDNVLIRALNRVGDVMILSIVFLITSLPIVTIGASITAMYYTTMKSLTIEDGYVFKFYMKSFKENFKQSTIMWLISLVILYVLGVDVWFWYKQWTESGSNAMQVMLIISIVMLAVAVMIIMYVFPLQAKFDNTIKVQFRNAFLLSIKFFPTTILLAAITAIVVWMFYYQFVLAVIGFALFGIGIMGYVYGFFMSKCFKPFLEPAKVDEEEDFDDEDDYDDEDESLDKSEDEEGVVEESEEEPEVRVENEESNEDIEGTSDNSGDIE